MNRDEFKDLTERIAQNCGEAPKLTTEDWARLRRDLKAIEIPALGQQFNAAIDEAKKRLPSSCVGYVLYMPESVGAPMTLLGIPK